MISLYLVLFSFLATLPQALIFSYLVSSLCIVSSEAIQMHTGNESGHIFFPLFLLIGG